MRQWKKKKKKGSAEWFNYHADQCRRCLLYKFCHLWELVQFPDERHTDIQKETLGERFFLLLLSPSEERKEEVIYDFISSRIRIVPDASSTSPFHPSRFFCVLLTLYSVYREGELVMRFLSAAPADFLGRFLFCVWSAKEYPWWMLSPSSFLIFLLPFSIERERGNTYIAHTNIYEEEAQRFVWRPEKTQPIPFSPNDNNNNQYSLYAFSIYNIQW